MKIVISLIIYLFLLGCSTYGSRLNIKLTEIENSYQKGEITKYEYLQLKEQARQTMYLDKTSRGVGTLE